MTRNCSIKKPNTVEIVGAKYAYMCGGGLVAGDHVTSDALVVQVAHHMSRLRPHCIRYTCGGNQ